MSSSNKQIQVAIADDHKLSKEGAWQTDQFL